MLNVQLNKRIPFTGDSTQFKQDLKPASSGLPEVSRSTVTYSPENVKANFLPALSFKGIHRDALIGIETKVHGISNYQDNATRVKYRFINRNMKGDKKKIELRLEQEPSNQRDRNAIAVYHDYKGKSMKLGYLAAPIAGRINPLIEEGYKFSASVVNAAGGKGTDCPNVGVRIRLEYLTSPDRSPNNRKIENVREAFKRSLADGSALTYREEKLYNSKEYKRATKMRYDSERQEATAYRAGWEQLRVEVNEDPVTVNSRKRPQNPKFTEHVKRAVKHIAEKMRIKKKPETQPKEQ